MRKKINDPSFRFPMEYSEEYKDAPFIKDGKIFYCVSSEKIAKINQIAERNLTFLNNFRGKKFKALNNLCCRMNYGDSVKVVGNTKIVAIWRDPRSQYSQVIQRTNKDNIPVEFSTVDTYIDYFKKEVAPWINGRSPNVLAVRFEDLCLNYKTTVQKIEDFIGLKASDHAFPLMFFNPVDSIKNINYWENADCQDEIDKIYQTLSEYCHDFRKINWFKYQKIRLSPHFAQEDSKKYLKVLKRFYNRKTGNPEKANEEKILKQYCIQVFGTENPSDEIVKEAFSEAIKNRTYEIEAFNKRFLSFAAIVGAIFVGCYSVDNAEIASVLKNIGIIVSTLWFCMICGSKHWQSYWERHVEMLEQKRGFTLYGMSAKDLQKITKKRLQGFKMPMFLIHALTACVSLFGFYLLMK